MTILQAIVLGLLQGATEFLPISSSGHLVLVPWLLGWEASSLTFDTTVHLGTLLAVLIYFRQDVWALMMGWFKTVQTRTLEDTHGRLAWFILLGTIPAGLFGLLFEDFFEQLFNTPALVSTLLLVTGLILFISERLSQRIRNLESLRWRDSLLIGLAQAGAIAPGISRSGATIAAGLAVGIKREVAARFSFLLSLPIILGAGLLKLKDALEIGITQADMANLSIGFLMAGLSGYACIHFLMAYLRERNLYPFAIYCWGFGLLCLFIALSG